MRLYTILKVNTGEGNSGRISQAGRLSQLVLDEWFLVVERDADKDSR